MQPKQNTDPNSWLLPETAAAYEVVNWKFGHMIHHPGYAHLGHPNGRVNLKDLKPKYAGQLVDAGFPYLRRKAAETVETADVSATETPETPAKHKKKGK